jgi:carbon storage regulator
MGGMMLVLTRKSEEAIKLGDSITITVVEIKGNKVRLGIDAPDGVRIYRKELFERIKNENVLSAGSSVDEFAKIKDVLG